MVWNRKLVSKANRKVHDEPINTALVTIFNQHAQEIRAVAQSFGTALVCRRISMDQQTKQLAVEFIFAAGSTPDLAKLPEKIGGELEVKHKFRPFLALKGD